MTFDPINFVLSMMGTVAFAITGVLTVSERWVDFFSVVVLGVITAIGGGLLRDVLAGRKPLLMTDEVYTLPVFAGCLVMLITISLFADASSEGVLVDTLLTLVLPSAAVHWSWRLPDWFLTKSKSSREGVTA